MVWLHHVPSLVPKIFDQFVWHRDRSERAIYLTFDDGPVPGVTDFVLGELARRSMRATFFMVGDNVARHPSLAGEVRDAGHHIGNHTHNHLNGSRTKDQVYLENIRICQSVLEETLHVKPKNFRPPYGRITKSQQMSLANDFQLVMWDVLSGDFDSGLDPMTCLRKSKQYTRNGSIVVFHDQEKTRSILPKVLPQYLDWLAENGFKTESL